MDLPMISVIGPVEPDLITAWISHYQALGVTRFLTAHHTVPGTDPEQAHAALDRYTALAGPPMMVTHGPWHEDVQTQLRDQLRTHAGRGWALYADIDELHAWPAPPPQLLDDQPAEQTGTVGGLLLDRVARDGRLRGWDTGDGLDNAYPLGGFLTHHLLRGDPRKIVAARADVPLAAGCHRAPGHRPLTDPPIPVHHFKWRDGVLTHLRQRAENMGRAWNENSPAIRTEAATFLNHIAAHDERINVHDPALPMRPVTLTTAPAWWVPEARHIVETWRPPRWTTPMTPRLRYSNPHNPAQKGDAVPATVYLLVGLTGSGKTTYAKKLAERGVVRLSIDEELFNRHGRYGVDYHESRYFELEAPIVAEVRERLGQLIDARTDVVLDHGLWLRTDRDFYKKLIEAHGGCWRLFYFEVPRDELLRRLGERNRREDANALTVTPEALDDFYARFEPPSGEGEESPPDLSQRQ